MAGAAFGHLTFQKFWWWLLLLFLFCEKADAHSSQRVLSRARSPLSQFIVRAVESMRLQGFQYGTEHLCQTSEARDRLVGPQS